MDITQAEVVRLRPTARPPAIVLEPALADVGTLEFRRAAKVLEAGRAAAQATLPRLSRLVRESG